MTNRKGASLCEAANANFETGVSKCLSIFVIQGCLKINVIHSSDNWLWFVGCLNCDASDLMIYYDSAVVCYLDEIRFWKIVCKMVLLQNAFCADIMSLSL